MKKNICYYESYESLILKSLTPKKKKRATGFEPATPSLGSSYSTTELCPLTEPYHTAFALLFQAGFSTQLASPVHLLPQQFQNQRPSRGRGILETVAQQISRVFRSYLRRNKHTILIYLVISIFKHPFQISVNFPIT